MLIALILLSLLLSALFSGMEIAFVSANKLRVELKKKKSARRGGIISSFYDNPSGFLGTMLVGNNIALVLFTTLMTKLVEPSLLRWAPLADSSLLLLLTETLIVTLVVLVFGEFLPKTLFRLFADQMLYFLAVPVQVLRWLLRAPAWVMIKLSNQLLRLFRTPAEQVENAFTRLDLENFIRDTQTDEEEDIDKELFGKALNLRDVRVRECMIPRPEIESIDLRASVEELEQLFKDTKLSRIVITDEDIDNVLGYVHHQQLLKQPSSIKQLIMDLPFVPEAMRGADLLNRFIRDQVNIAVVVDEFGGISGLITLEDLLEEIFGEIEDEHDQEEYVETIIEEGKEYIFSGRLEIDFLNEKYDLGLPEGDYHTLSGYIISTTGTIPEQHLELAFDGFRFVLELVSDTKIETVRIIREEEVTLG